MSWTGNKALVSLVIFVKNNILHFCRALIITNRTHWHHLEDAAQKKWFPNRYWNCNEVHPSGWYHRNIITLSPPEPERCIKITFLTLQLRDLRVNIREMIQIPIHLIRKKIRSGGGDDESSWPSVALSPSGEEMIVFRDNPNSMAAQLLKTNRFAIPSLSHQMHDRNFPALVCTVFVCNRVTLEITSLRL